MIAYGRLVALRLARQDGGRAALAACVVIPAFAALGPWRPWASGAVPSAPGLVAGGGFGTAAVTVALACGWLLGDVMGDESAGGRGGALRMAGLDGARAVRAIATAAMAVALPLALAAIASPAAIAIAAGVPIEQASAGAGGVLGIAVLSALLMAAVALGVSALAARIGACLLSGGVAWVLLSWLPTLDGAAPGRWMSVAALAGAAALGVGALALSWLARGTRTWA